MKGKTLLLLLTVFLLTLSLAVAAPVGANATAGASETGTSSSSTSIAIDGGNVTRAAVNSDSVAVGWAGFFGNISGTFFLSDASTNLFYQWTVGSMTGAVVYAANSTISDWSTGNVGPLLAANVPSWINTATTSGFNNTFSANETFTSAGYSGADQIENVSYVTTFNSSGTAGDLKTYALYATAESATIWAGKVVDDTSGFNGNSVDYQILLPAQTGTTYTFYTELN